jgi:hypothetical protein
MDVKVKLAEFVPPKWQRTALNADQKRKSLKGTLNIDRVPEATREDPLTPVYRTLL